MSDDEEQDNIEEVEKSANEHDEGGSPADDHVARDGTQWNRQPGPLTERVAHQNLVRKVHGPIRSVKERCLTPIAAFENFITIGMRTIVLECTNEEGQRQMGEPWITLTDSKLVTYFGLLY